VTGLGGEPVHLVWIRADERTLRQRLTRRGLERDAGKLEDFAAFAARMLQPPAVPHEVVDNRLDAEPLGGQVGRITARITERIMP
jgi:hypothetical protein